MKYITQFFKSFFAELIIIFIFIFLINNYFGNAKTTANADGKGYYDYLPSIFIHHDLIRKGSTSMEDSLLYDRFENLKMYKDYKGYKVNKHACGTAVLQLPFFTYTYLTTNLEGSDEDGYQFPFQVTIFYATIFYLFLGIYFLKKVLELYELNKYAIIISQLLLVLATSVTIYANTQAGFSHVYSLFAITAFIYFTKSYFKNNNLNHFLLACLFFGLVFILRQINILIILFVPFLAGSIKNLAHGFKTVLLNPKKLILGLFITTAVFSIQLVLWYLQTGDFFVYSYQGEGFYFMKPQFFNILFSYQKGLFIYTPITFVSIFGLVWLLYKREYYLFVTWTTFFLILTYILSSWHSWFYGASYGLRAYIDYYAIFFILFALMLNDSGKITKTMIIFISLLTIPLNVIQSYQYNSYILHFVLMDKEKYWEVFLKTENRFKGLLWKRSINEKYYTIVKEVSLGDIKSSTNTIVDIFKISSLEIPDFENVIIIQVCFDNDFSEVNESKVIVGINGAKDKYNFYWHARYLIHFFEKELNKWQTGIYNYEFDPIAGPDEKIINLRLESVNQDNYLKNVRLRFLVSKSKRRI
jgi:hypothetical protein